MKLFATMTVSEFKKLVLDTFNTHIEIYTSKKNIAGENRKLKALCSKEGINWPITLDSVSLSDFVSRLKHEIDLSVEIINEEKKLVPDTKFTIKISGRIAKYYFGKLKQEIANEIELALPLCSSSSDDANPLVFRDEITGIQEFLQFFLCNTLENAFEDRANFRQRVSMNEFENMCPILYAIFSAIENQNWNNFQLYDSLFTPTPFLEQRLRPGFISFFEPDSTISIKDSENNEILTEMKLDVFSEKKEITAQDASSRSEKNAINLYKNFAKKHNKKFGIDFDENKEIGLNKSNSIFITYPIQSVNEEFKDNRELCVTIEHDDIADYLFTIEDTTFSFEKLIFLTYSNAQDLRETSFGTVFNYLFYSNNLILPAEIWYRDKGISLKYEDEYQDISFLLDA
jgi:hypothetical protein